MVHSSLVKIQAYPFCITGLTETGKPGDRSANRGASCQSAINIHKLIKEISKPLSGRYRQMPFAGLRRFSDTYPARQQADRRLNLPLADTQPQLAAAQAGIQMVPTNARVVSTSSTTANHRPPHPW